MTPQEWNTILAPHLPNEVAWGRVGMVAREYLFATVPQGDMISTATLVNGLYPEAYAKQSDENAAARRRIVDALISKTGCIKYELADCVSFGAAVEKRVYGKKRRVMPRLWHQPIRI